MIRISRWVWAVVFAGTFGVIDLVLVQERPAAELAIELRSTESSQARVFFDTGSGFNERESVSRALPAASGPRRLFFPFPARPVRSIRFDPLEISGIVEVRGLVVQKPDSHAQLARIDPLRIEALNEIASLTPRAGLLEIRIVEHAADPQLLIPLQPPLEIRRSAKDLLSGGNVRTSALWTAIAAGIVFVASLRSKLRKPIGAVNAFFDRCCRWSEDSKALRLDRTALWFYSFCLFAFVLFSVAKLHGSSISIAGTSYRGWTDVAHTPLLGTPKKVRSDEWSFHTPTILNQLYRRDSLTVNDTLLGPGKAALLGNVPCWHFTQIFRPQFWAFFVLPPDFAFSLYWQTKALLLLTGLFTLLLLITRSSGVAAICALWFFFSAYTQWAYSWASLLPEMVGLFCWTISLTCYQLVGRNRLGLLAAAVVTSVCAVNFALCAYPPHQLPLIVFGVAILAAWIWSRWDSVWNQPGRGLRLISLLTCWVVMVGAVMWWFYWDAKDTLLAAAATVYPGQRSTAGGGVPLAQFVSHFLDFWKSEENFPAAQGNVCEASGYLWLAPMTLLLARPAKQPSPFRAFVVCSWIAFLLLFSWMLFPIPASAARWFFFDRVPPVRCFPALGLINIAIVGIFLADRRRTEGIKQVITRHWPALLVTIVLLLLIFFIANKNLGDFFPGWAIAVAGLYVALLTLLLTRARPGIFAAFLLVPLVLANGLINPIDRGLAVITDSSLFKKAHGDQDKWRDGKWLIYAPWADQPGLLAATGINVVDCLKIIPDRERMGVFDPDNRSSQVINRSSYFFAIPIGKEEPTSFAGPSIGNVVWKVTPRDGRLKQIGVDRVAFAYRPPSPELDREVAPFLEANLPGLKVYHLP